MRSCTTCQIEGDRPHTNRTVPVSGMCPEGVERERAKRRRYAITAKGRQVRRNADARYSTTSKGVLRDVRANARRRGNRG